MTIILLLLGLLLIYLEFYLPGGIFGIIGGITLGISIILFAQETGSWLAVLAYVAIVLILLLLLIKITLKRIPKAKSQYSIYLEKDQEGYIASTFDRTAIGKEGVVTSDLKPGGYILIEGKKHQAISQSGYIPKGTKVKVIAGQEESLIVRTQEPFS